VQDTTILIYDGECPFCNKFAELVELQSGIENLRIKDGRENKSELKRLKEKGYDLDMGAIVINNEEILQGSIAITWIFSQISNPSTSLIYLLKYVFSSTNRAKSIYPFLLYARRAILFARGIPRKINVH
tara:strand:- start:8 stop:394 length:387 start_codon:yes stop_codon:yes gene_type:complete